MAGLRGRPRKPADERRDAYVRVRLTRAEHAKINRAAAKRRLHLSEWARRGLLLLADRDLD